MLHLPRLQPVVIACRGPQVIGAGLAAVRSQDIEKIKYGHIVIGVMVEPVVHQPRRYGPGPLRGAVDKLIIGRHRRRG